jgi:hypothetical protein
LIEEEHRIAPNHLRLANESKVDADRVPGLNGHTMPAPFCGRHREPLRGKRTAIWKGEDEPGSLPTLAGGSKLDPLPVAVLAQRAVVVMWSRATSLTLAEDIGVTSSARPVGWRRCRTPCVQIDVGPHPARRPHRGEAP